MSGKGEESTARASEAFPLGPVAIPRIQLATLLAIVLLLVSLSACEQVQASRNVGDKSLKPRSSQVENLALAKAQDAKAAASLYRASQRAARRGDFRMGLFHLHAAASAGFDDYLAVLGDPLLRPLHSGARWTLVLDLIKKSYLSDSSMR